MNFQQQLRNATGGMLLALLPALAAGQAAPAAATSPDTAAAPRPLYTPGGVRYLVHEQGAGPLPVPGSRLAVRYTGFLPSGKAFDATKPTGGPLRFRVGRGEVIKGWDEVLLLFPAGTKLRAWIPAPLAYGAKGVTYPEDENRYVIPPNTELVFELHVVSIK